MAKKKTTTNQKTKLQNELKKLIKDINEEGLLFLIEQANILRYNMQVDKINKAQEKAVKSAKSKSGSKKSKAASKTVRSSIVKITSQDNNQNFTVQLGSEKKFFSRADFRGMVLVCQSKDPVATVSKRLYNWLNRERKDILIDLDISSQTDQLLKNIIKEIKSKYKAKSR